MVINNELLSPTVSGEGCECLRFEDIFEHELDTFSYRATKNDYTWVFYWKMLVLTGFPFRFVHLVIIIKKPQVNIIISELFVHLKNFYLNLRSCFRLILYLRVKIIWINCYVKIFQLLDLIICLGIARFFHLYVLIS